MKKRTASVSRRVLLIWENIPEDTHLYAIPCDRLTEADHEVFAAGQGRYINEVGLPAAARSALWKVNDSLCEKADYLSENNPAGTLWAMRFTDCKVGDPQPITPNSGFVVTHVYRMGMIL